MRFTRSEARTLALLARHPERIATREMLLDGLSEVGSDRNERNIDFIINRLRRKLSDNARDPRFIATRYGEGYLWVAAPPVLERDAEEADMIVGPLRGLAPLGPLRGQAEAFAAEVFRATKSQVAEGQRVAFLPSGAQPHVRAGTEPKLTLELTFFAEAGQVHCITAAKLFDTGRILAMHRNALASNDAATGSAMPDVADELARRVLNDAWHMIATSAESGGPLPVMMHLAGLQKEPEDGTATDSLARLKALLGERERHSMASWKLSERRIQELRADAPDDPRLKILQASHLHTKYILFGHKLFADGVDGRAEDEDGIETLVLEAMPHIRGAPEVAIMGAKLLHFLDRGYKDLAREIAEDAYRSSLAVDSALPLIGQLRAYHGDFEAALPCLDQALHLATPRSKTHLYALTIKCQALVAAADAKGLAESRRELYAVSPLAPLFFEPMFGDPHNLSLRGRVATMALSRKMCVGVLMHCHYTSARLFLHEAQRDNVIRCVLTIVARRFGPSAIPAEVAARYPKAMAELS
ncbi:hypothetical protein AYJ57_18960 [Salipiger sp. CCB-MM3]|uniref:helix-turn-helix domain-containing protein n=1 Tax=Salipiger sp. CCB-MM3 TaxID=1792508 RepID=UPI00080A970E|nr:helix-turn-helix domain-containing protein [Salipiger sp. CCB-MM3]ANT62474.1 hypothetical protein AYJ57_18960 [Salipiger sp. CCB-MM3]